ncbi:MAG: hypothetical protein NFCOHLIN_03097 [Gammaproteobacteria bacterium]|nr:hypothetical protein [Gammaproteobacteria bacterium]
MKGQREEARKAIPRIGALVTGIGGHGMACWITGVTGDEISLVVAHDATLGEREVNAHTLLVNLSCFTGRKWHLISLRGRASGIAGRALRVRLAAPVGPEVQAYLLACLSGGAAPLAGRSAVAEAAPVEGAPAGAGSIPPAAAKSPAQVCRAIAAEHGARWMHALFAGIDEALIEEARAERHPAFRRRLEEDRATLALGQAAIQEEVAAQFAESVDDMFSPTRDVAARERTMDRTMGLMNTAGLADMMSFVDVVQAVDRTTHPQVLALERRLSQMLQKAVNEDNNLLRAERLCEIVLGVIIDRWPGGASNRKAVTDAIGDTAAILNKAYMAMNDALAPPATATASAAIGLRSAAS